MRKIRIGYLADGGDAGGARTHILTLLNSLPKEKFEIYFFALGDGALSHSVEKIANINLTVYPLKSKFNLNIIKKILKWAKDTQLDILHTHGLKANMYGRIALLKHPITLLTTYHSNPLYDYDSIIKGIIFAIIDQLTLSRTNQFIAVSYEIARQLERRGVNREKITIIKNGVNLKEDFAKNVGIKQIEEIKRNLNIPKDSLVLGSLGRLVKVKDYPYMLDCFKAVRERLNKDIYLLLIGGGEEEKNLKLYSEKLGISEYVKFAGFQKNPEPYILATDLMFFTPRAEALGIAVLETMSLRKPVVARKTGGIGEIIIDNYNGYIKPDKNSLINACISLLNDDKKKKIFTEAGLKTVKRFFTNEKMIEKTAFLYEELSKERIYLDEIPLDCIRMKDAIKKAESFLYESRCNQIVTLNIEMIARASKDKEIKKAISESELVLPDGVSTVILGRSVGGNIPERIAGIEFSEALLKLSCEKNLKVYFLGGKREVSEKLSPKLKKVYPQLLIAGTYDGYFKEYEESKIIEEINKSGADILFVGLGAGKQEIFINRHKRELKPKIAIGVGGSLDVWVGKVKRAPSIFIKLNIEWLYRIFSQPRERIKRFLSTIPTFYKAMKCKNTKKKNILISGYYGYGNIGDEAILTTLIRDIKSLTNANNYNISVLSATPHATSTLNDGIFAIQRFDIYSVLKEIKRANYVISGGGGLIQDVTSWKSPLYYLGIIGLAKLLNKKVLIYANGVGPLNYKFNRFLTSIILNKVDKITVRDEDSLKLLRRLGVKKAKLTVDPIFSFKPIESLDPYNELNDFIAVSLGFSKETVKLIGDFAKFFDYVSEKTGKTCLFTPFYYLKDYEFSSKIASKMKNKPEILQTILLPSEMLSLLNRTHLGVGMRLHFIIFSAINEKAILPFLYDPKVKAYSQILELNYALKSNMSLDEMKKEFDSFYSNNTATELLSLKVKELKERNNLNVETLKAFLNDA
jgi:polysaccharide pyruvyl transferase CsaB